MRESFHQFNPSIFLADNIKGIVGDSLTLEDAYYIGKVLGTMTKYLKGERALIGYDSRNSSTVLENELARGLNCYGYESHVDWHLPVRFIMVFELRAQS